MSRRAPDRRSGWRTVNATMAGVVAGVCGVALTRAIFGPRVIVAGLVFGALAVLAGVSLSLGWTDRKAGSRATGVGGIRVRRRVHPLAWFAPVVGSAVAMGAWAGVAHSSGSGWVQAVGALMAAVLITGLLAPVVPARRAGIICHTSPGDGEAGRPVELSMEANGPLRVRPVYPVGVPTRAEGATHGPRPVVVTITPDRRGVVDRVVVELASSAPFGLLWWAREVDVPLPRPLHVAPRFGEPDPVVIRPDAAPGSAQQRIPSGYGEPRGVRPYQPGDTRRSIHWPATSHVGTLMVREKERQTDDPVVIEVVLPADDGEAESVSERVMATASGFLGRGQPVVMVTTEARGRVARPVYDRVDVGRRLARAVSVGARPGRPAPYGDRSVRWGRHR